MLDDLKRMYNFNLQRYYNGCSYCEEHRDEIDKWMPELDKIEETLNCLLDKIKEHQSVTSKEVTEGFIVE